MEYQTTLWEKEVLVSDIVYTPNHVAKNILDFLNPKGTCLDPCKGDGAFYNLFPSDNRDYCEIREGKDFFLYNEKVDWVIGNPPYSIFEDFLNKAFEISKNVSYLVPTNKIFQRQIIMESINKWGGGKEYYNLWGRNPYRFSIWVFRWKLSF